MRRSAPEFWSSCRLWNGRWPGPETPFCALSVAMDFDDRGVDHGVFHVWRVGAGLEKPGENIRFDPVAVALENSVPVAEQRRKITPRAARLHDPKYRFDEAAVVASAAPGVRWLTQTMRLHLRPLGVRQHESFHSKLESQPSRRWNLDSQQTLERFPARWTPVRVKKTRQTRNRVPFRFNRNGTLDIADGFATPLLGLLGIAPHRMGFGENSDRPVVAAAFDHHQRLCFGGVENGDGFLDVHDG